MRCAWFGPIPFFLQQLCRAHSISWHQVGWHSDLSPSRQRANAPRYTTLTGFHPYLTNLSYPKEKFDEFVYANLIEKLRAFEAGSIYMLKLSKENNVPT